LPLTPRATLRFALGWFSDGPLGLKNCLFAGASPTGKEFTKIRQKSKLMFRIYGLAIYRVNENQQVMLRPPQPTKKGDRSKSVSFMMAQ